MPQLGSARAEKFQLKLITKLCICLHKITMKIRLRSKGRKQFVDREDCVLQVKEVHVRFFAKEEAPTGPFGSLI